MQVAQLFTSMVVLISQPSAGEPLQFAKPALHAPITHALDAQLAAALANEHAWPQLPQLVTLLVRIVSHPLAVLPSQSPWPAAQLERVHAPLVHEAPPPMNEHTFPHDPQLPTLFNVLVSQPLPGSPSQSA